MRLAWLNLALVSSAGTAAEEYEGLVLLKRYGSTVLGATVCDRHRTSPYPQTFPTTRGLDLAAHAVGTNTTVMVFDFEEPSLGIGNCECNGG